MLQDTGKSLSEWISFNKKLITDQILANEEYVKAYYSEGPEHAEHVEKPEGWDNAGHWDSTPTSDNGT